MSLLESLLVLQWRDFENPLKDYLLEQGQEEVTKAYTFVMERAGRAGRRRYIRGFQRWWEVLLWLDDLSYENGWETPPHVQ